VWQIPELCMTKKVFKAASSKELTRNFNHVHCQICVFPAPWSLGKCGKPFFIFLVIKQSQNLKIIYKNKYYICVYVHITILILNSGFHVLYHLCHVSRSFALVTFYIGSCFFFRLPWTEILLFTLPTVAWITDATSCSIFLLRWGLVNILPSLSWKHCSLDISLLSR
jgi:hypothetical protein